MMHPPVESDRTLRCNIAYNSYGGYCVPLSSSHRPAAQAILAGRIWEPDTIEFMVSHCGDGDVVHAGTFFGDFFPALSRGVSASARIWAFEPNPENYRCATVTCIVNGLSNVELTHAGLSDCRREASIMIADRHGVPLGGASHIVHSLDDVGTSKCVRTELLAVDEVIPPDREVSIIQLDVERYETQALSGAMATIRRCRPILILESLPPDDWLLEHLHPLGYAFLQILHGNKVLCPQPGAGWKMDRALGQPAAAALGAWRSDRSPSAEFGPGGAELPVRP